MPASEPKSPLARWSAELEALPALSLKQPWAWLVVSGHKDIENRSWKTTYRGSLLIQASSSSPAVTHEYIYEHYEVRVPDELKLGGIIGLVDVVDCVKRHPSKWKFSGRLGLDSRESPAAPVPAVQGLCRVVQAKAVASLEAASCAPPSSEAGAGQGRYRPVRCFRGRVRALARLML